MNWKEGDRNRMQILKMSPRILYDEYMKARKEPYIIHFAGYQKPWNVVECDFSERFWEYARYSPYYIQLLKAIAIDLIENQKPKVIVQNAPSPEKKTLIRVIVDRLLPFKTKRREVIKQIYNMVIHPKIARKK